MSQPGGLMAQGWREWHGFNQFYPMLGSMNILLNRRWARVIIQALICSRGSLGGAYGRFESKGCKHCDQTGGGVQLFRKAEHELA